jgi:hypothetical protein
MNINKIPTDEMIVDLQESIYDASVCTAALARGIYWDRDGSSVDVRKQGNEKFIRTIEEELIRRGIDVSGIKRITFPMHYEYDRQIKT